MERTIITIAITDDHPILREGLIRQFSINKGFKVIADAGSGPELLDKLAKLEILPDVLLLDIKMRGMSGYEVMSVMKEKYPEVKVIALSMYDGEYAVAEMFRRGARGYLQKGRHDGNDVKEAVLAVSEGNYYHPKKSPGDRIGPIQNNGNLVGITPREMEFLGYCISELTYKEIAEKMHISERTVHGYRNILFDKLKLKKRSALAAFALNNGIAEINHLKAFIE